MDACLVGARLETKCVAHLMNLLSSLFSWPIYYVSCFMFTGKRCRFESHDPTSAHLTNVDLFRTGNHCMQSRVFNLKRVVENFN
jgi:hypothetical protein